MRSSTMCVVAALFLSGAAGALGQVLNGGFENNIAGTTIFNLSNANYNSLVADSTAFGLGDEIDLVGPSGFGNMTPQTGNFMVGLHNRPGNGPDALSLTLGSQVLMGQQYYLTFASALYDFARGGQLVLGLSGSATSLGTQILTVSPGSDTTWTLYGYTFTAPVTAGYLTLSVAGDDGYVFADSVGLQLVPAPAPLALMGLGLGGMAVRRRRR